MYVFCKKYAQFCLRGVGKRSRLVARPRSSPARPSARVPVVRVSVRPPFLSPVRSRMRPPVRCPAVRSSARQLVRSRLVRSSVRPSGPRPFVRPFARWLVGPSPHRPVTSAPVRASVCSTAHSYTHPLVSSPVRASARPCARPLAHPLILVRAARPFAR